MIPDFRIFGLAWRHNRSNLMLVIPYWMPVTLTVVLAVAPWIWYSRWRFSLRVVFIATTIVCTLLSLFAWMQQ